jgi:hypothetical protein
MMSALARMSVPEVNKMIRLLEIVVVRFLVIGGGNTGRFETICAKLAKSIFASEVKTAREAFEALREVYPSDADFETAFRLKTERNTQKARYFLRALEMEAQVQANGKSANEWEPTALSLEHILPKKPGPEWAASVKADKDLADECTNRLGNMCLLLAGTNTALSSQGFAKKTVAFAKSDLLTTQEVSKYSDWDRAAIDGRQAKMAKSAKAVWRFK